jgi:uncharacterized protein
MSASQTPPPGPGPGAEPGAGAGAAGDPSMEDILASIRRILSEDEAPAPGAAVTSPTAPPERHVGEHVASDHAPSDGVLVLDPAMMVSKPPENATAEPEPAPEPMPVPVPHAAPAPAVTTSQTLIAPEAAAAAVSSLDGLVRTLATERSMQVHSGGPTIEDIVREELRPLLKAWLDANLPPMVERLVRVEIERVVGRVAP